MKKLIYYIGFLFCIGYICSCQRHKVKVSEKKDVINIPLPIGSSKLKDFHFPKKWDCIEGGVEEDFYKIPFNNITLTGFDSITILLDKYYLDFYSLLKLKKNQKLNFIPKITKLIDKDENDYFLIDSAYYVGTLYKDNKFTLEMFKNGGKFDEIINHDETKGVVNYLCLVSFDDNQNVLDCKTIYYFQQGDFFYTNRYFYFDSELNLVIKDFYSDEVETNFRYEEIDKVTPSGKFGQFSKIK